MNAAPNNVDVHNDTALEYCCLALYVKCFSSRLPVQWHFLKYSVVIKNTCGFTSRPAFVSMNTAGRDVSFRCDDSLSAVLSFNLLGT